VGNKLKSPHLFNAGSNPYNVITNLGGLLSAVQLQILREEVRGIVRSLFALGRSHYEFALTLPVNQWRQRISRLYYGAYNARRAIALEVDGSFSIDSSDHKNVNQIPDDFPNAAIFKVRITNLREDRNMADYNHLAQEADLVNPVSDYQELVRQFLAETTAYLTNRGTVV
jgi:hypothetical protein